MRTQIFISYRRNGGLEIAKKLYEALTNSYEVFFDMESLRSGRFDQKIEKSIQECTDFLLILSNQIFDRLEEDGDWISRELEIALKNEKNIIPIFLDDFTEPQTNNPTIKTIMNHNGIKYSDGAGFYETLISFLKSNKKCVLTLNCTDNGYKLNDCAINALKEIYQNTVNHKEYGVQIKLKFPDVHQSGEILVPKTLTDDKRRTEVDFKIQTLIRMHQDKHESIELAIEYMIGDTVNIGNAPLWSILQNEPLANEYFGDKDGRIYSYYPVCVWVHVIEELMKEFTLDAPNRLTYYRADRSNYVSIDCGIDHVSKDFKGDWYFVSHAKVSECDESVAHYQIIKPSPFSLSPTTILKMILPDFYYKAALEIRYSSNDKLVKEFSDPESNIRILENYWYGLH